MVTHSRLSSKSYLTDTFLQTAQEGNYTKAADLLNRTKAEVHRTLKFHQYLTTYTGVLKLKQQLHRYDSLPIRNCLFCDLLISCIDRDNLVASSYLLSQLKAASPLDPELNHELGMLEFDYLVRSKRLPAAFALIENLGMRLKEECADIYQRIKLLSCKAKLFAKAGQPQLGFSVALRAANSSLKARIIPAAWEAIGVMSNVLVSLREFGPAMRLLDAIIPQARS